MQRRDFLISTLASAAAIGISQLLTSRAYAQDLSATGKVRPELDAVDAWAKSFVTKNNIPGASLAIVHDGHLVYARGFGLGDKEAGTPVEPDSIFRIASVSKSFTGVAIMRLFQEGRLKLEDKVLDYFPAAILPTQGKLFDDRWKQITIAQCLTHTGGWDRDKSYDPMLGSDLKIAEGLGVSLPLTPQLIMQYQLGQRLDFDPGSRYAYSNFGYSILGRIIEAVSGRSYEDYVKEAVFKPLGLDRVQIGGSLLSERLDGEVKYYATDNQMAPAVVGPDIGKAQVPIAYGGWQERTLDAHGGWVASAIDLAKFGAAFDYVDGTTRGGILDVETTRLMFTPHASISPAKDSRPAQAYGYGWMVAGEGDKIISRHTGVLPSTGAVLLHFPSGINLGFIANIGQAPDGAFIGRMIDTPLTELVENIESLPAPL
ncbi:serine hydrolase domain-containing protein [Mesorhizobium sp. DCY119]|uniref:serine hydrolase domain-containing protein n=1 Tax=Mesorhizobium sp. DCY119 TaxID=2108445 RepID=UPI000E75A63D|nr:serine hydrolase domain-containing protein [Mesorhizobium sp. DCY119]RJG40619.1 class A beta-lactamase-related serine hydrolase [Mesorhizobium sp. DCY119]